MGQRPLSLMSGGGGDTRVLVCVRVKPLTPEDRAAGRRAVVAIPDRRSLVLTAPTQQTRRFGFDMCFDSMDDSARSYVDQEAVHKAARGEAELQAILRMRTFGPSGTRPQHWIDAARDAKVLKELVYTGREL